MGWPQNTIREGGGGLEVLDLARAPEVLPRQPRERQGGGAARDGRRRGLRARRRRWVQRDGHVLARRIRVGRLVQLRLQPGGAGAADAALLLLAARDGVGAAAAGFYGRMTWTASVAPWDEHVHGAAISGIGVAGSSHRPRVASHELLLPDIQGRA